MLSPDSTTSIGYGRIPDDRYLGAGSDTRLVVQRRLDLHLEPLDWVNVLAVVVAVHSGGERITVDLDTVENRRSLAVEVDAARTPKDQPQSPASEHKLLASLALVSDRSAPDNSYSIVVQLDGRTAVLWLDAAAFSASTRDRLALHLELLAVAEEPFEAIELPVVTSPTSLRSVPGSFEVRSEPEWGQCVIRRLREVIQAMPATTALVAGNRSLTYTELGDWAGGVASAIRCTAPGAARVAILAEHSIEPVVGMLAALAYGAAYVPLDPQLPDGRLRRVLRRCRPELVLHSPGLGSRAKNLAPLAAHAALTPCSAELVPPSPSMNADRLAYILFTSGSTGTPKGVVQTVPALMRHARNYRDSVALTAGETVPLMASVAFDAAVMDLYGGLLSGSTVHVVDPLQPAAILRAEIQTRPPAVLHGTPTLLRHLLDGAPVPWVELAATRTAVFGGERVSAEDVDRVRRALPGAYVINGLDG